MLRENFERRKAEIEQEISDMLECLQQMLQMAIDSMSERDPAKLQDTLKAIRRFDRKVNDYEESVYHHCIQLISLEQPVASDLRFSIGVLKFIGDLERFGDHCVHLVKILCRNAELEVSAELPSGLLEMTEHIHNMYAKCTQAVKELDTDLARELIHEDNLLDDVHKSFIKENARSINESPELSESYTNFMFLSRFIERIGDHMVNTCEWLIFMSEGTRPS